MMAWMKINRIYPLTSWIECAARDCEHWPTEHVHPFLQSPIRLQTDDRGQRPVPLESEPPESPNDSDRFNPLDVELIGHRCVCNSLTDRGNAWLLHCNWVRFN